MRVYLGKHEMKGMLDDVIKHHVIGTGLRPYNLYKDVGVIRWVSGLAHWYIESCIRNLLRDISRYLEVHKIHKLESMHEGRGEGGSTVTSDSK